MTIYDFDVKQPNGESVNLGIYEGQVLVMVNTASYCGYTKQLFGLERDYKTYHNQGLETLAFPANQFHNQEPDAIEEILHIYHEKYGVTFPIFDKIKVNGTQASPLFTFLKDEIGFDPCSNVPESMIPLYKEENPQYKNSADIKWNFTKFVIDKNGNVRYRFEPEQTPSKMISCIEELLKE